MLAFFVRFWLCFCLCGSVVGSCGFGVFDCVVFAVDLGFYGVVVGVLFGQCCLCLFSLLFVWFG